jgi:hypothetical protein
VRRLAAGLLLLAVTACSDGYRTGSPAPSPTVPATHSATPAQAPPAHGALAFATRSEVRLRDKAGATSTAGPVPDGAEVLALAWTGDGRYLGWLTVSVGPLQVGMHDTATGRTAAWTAPDGFTAYTLGATADAFVLVGEQDDRRLALLDPATVLADGDATYADLDVEDPSLLTTGAGRVLVASSALASHHGGPMEVYDVTTAGRATRLFEDGEGLPEGEVRNLAMGSPALDPDGKRLLYVTGGTAGGCEASVFVTSRDLARDREVGVPQPAIPRAKATYVRFLTTTADGTTYAAATAKGGDLCLGNDTRSMLFRRTGRAWRVVATDATWGAPGPDGTLAVLRRSGRLVVGAETVANGVTAAAWAPGTS